jgi:hypothetical protein
MFIIHLILLTGINFSDNDMSVWVLQGHPQYHLHVKSVFSFYGLSSLEW